MLNNENTFKPFLRDGVDVYISDNREVHFVFLATKRRISIKLNPELLEVLPLLDGFNTIDQIFDLLRNAHPKLEINKINNFVSFLHSKGVVIKSNWLDTLFPALDIRKFERNLNFFLDIEETEDAAALLFKRIRSTKISIFGLGAIGSWMFFELFRLGFKDFVLIDYATLDKFDSSRFAFFDETLIGQRKVDICAENARRYSNDVQVLCKPDVLDFSTTTSELVLSDTDLLVNCADEPYIGATNIKLSRFALENNIPLVAAGGFDAHLGSLSEVIIPNETPCADCYATFFDESLKNWKPIKHPIADRSKGFGGMSPLAVFAASNAVLKIISLLRKDTNSLQGGRGELAFSDYSIDSFEVIKDPNCRICS